MSARFDNKNRDERTPDQDEPKDTDRVQERTETPPDSSVETGFETDNPHSRDRNQPKLTAEERADRREGGNQT